MKKEDYEAIAKIVKKLSWDDSVLEIDGDDGFVNHLINGLADYFEQEDNEYLIGFQKRNLKFSRKEFLKQCGVTKWNQ